MTTYQVSDDISAESAAEIVALIKNCLGEQRVEHVAGIEVYAVYSTYPEMIPFAKLHEALHEKGFIMWRLSVLDITEGFMVLMAIRRYKDESF